MNRYLRDYGIMDNLTPDPERYYPLVAINPVDDVSQLNPTHELIKRFIRERITSHTGLSLTEFLLLPRSHTELIFATCSLSNQKEDNEAENLMNELKNIR